MKTWVRKTLSVGVLAAGALLFAPAAAQADVIQSNGDNNGILNGTQLAVPVRVPVNVVGTSVGILGVADSRGAGVNHIESGRRNVQSNGDNNGILNGTQAYLPVNVPVNVVGTAAAVAGHAQASGVGVNQLEESGRTTEHGWRDRDGDIQSNGDNNGILNGTQLYAPIDVPINVCGTSIALLGAADSRALCVNNLESGKASRKESVRRNGGDIQSNGDNNGIANGTQLYAPISLPVNLSGTSVAVLGASDARAVSVNKLEKGAGHHDDFIQSNGDNNGILNGTQIGVPINVPINVCGTSIGILGAAQSSAACVNDLSDRDGRDRGGFWGGDDWDGDWDGHHGHGHGKPGHGHGDDDDFGGAQGEDPDDYKGNGGVKGDDDRDKPGYSQDEEPADAQGEEPMDEEPAAGYTKPAATGSDTKATGGRKAMTEGSPVTDLAGTVGDATGLGLLNTLR
ncbi:chaplin family protein [Paractinoplanes atraurantiacus]|uniref:Small secreted domain n=1 Tax=Paractinoplanes atraurantiacus TaxID=1036182 RepID=A0A285JVR0_9ACTN|nr:chaplin family protein [Actinoplanes atraurantiacus]SNY63161.1 Small secreted domain [Actinoplanes atraurantiacus]